MTTKTYNVQEFGSQMQISAELRRRMDVDMVEQLIKENLRKDAIAQGCTEVSEPEVMWGTNYFRMIGNDEDGYEQVGCGSNDEGAFVHVGARMKVIVK